MGPRTENHLCLASPRHGQTKRRYTSFRGVRHPYTPSLAGGPKLTLGGRFASSRRRLRTTRERTDNGVVLRDAAESHRCAERSG
jgi:hypothetical protein